ncbi:MAG: toll/interleukin-1 receptor domain-containing protein [Bacilli bacterium]|nr:toll/interleukin-1 receptor domain-containing protein [Bacilli bacterium]
MDKEMQQRMIMMERRQHIKTAIKNIDVLLQALSLHMSKMQDCIEESFDKPKKDALDEKLNACIKLQLHLERTRVYYENTLIQAEVSNDIALLLQYQENNLHLLCNTFGLKEKEGFRLFYEHIISSSRADLLLERALEKTTSDWNKTTGQLSASPTPSHGGLFGRKKDKDATPVLMEQRIPKEAKPTPVQYSLLAPKRIEKGQSFLLDFYMYEKEYEDVIKEAFALGMSTLQKKDAGFSSVSKGSEITTRLYSPSLPDINDTDTFLWEGGYHVSQLCGTIPEEYPSNTLLLCVDILLYGARLTTLKCVIQLDKKEQECNFLRVDIKKAFFSYSSLDRDIVLTLKQGMEGLCPDIQCFVDFLFLQGGQQWLEEVHHKIDESDCLFLIWSENAYKSEWVKEEWTYALGTKGIGFIHPLAIEAVDKSRCPVPKALESIHFGNVNALLRKK